MGNKFLALESALNMVLNINIGKDKRLQNLKMIGEYADGLIHLKEEHKHLLSSVLSVFRLELQRETVNEECISGYTHILKECLNVNCSLKNPKCIVFGDNWLSEEIKNRMRSMNYCVLDWHAANPSYIDECDLFLLCDEYLKVYGLRETDEEKTVKIWEYLKYKFVVFPSFYEAYMNFKRQCGQKIKCIITGDSNIKKAIPSNILHTKTAALANYAQDIYYDYQLFCHALSFMPELEYAVIGLEPYSLHYDMSRSRVDWRRCLPYYPIVHTMHNCTGAKELIALYEDGEKKIKSYFDEEYIDSLYDVYAAQAKPVADGRADVYDSGNCAKDSSALHTREMRELYHKPFPEIVEENKKILEKYTGLCAEKKIKTLLVIPPYTDWYKEHMDREYYEELLLFLNYLCKRYGAMLIDLCQYTFPDSCFGSYSGVNCLGAVKAASYINEVIDHG